MFNEKDALSRRNTIGLILAGILYVLVHLLWPNQTAVNNEVNNNLPYQLDRVFNYDK